MASLSACWDWKVEPMSPGFISPDHEADNWSLCDDVTFTSPKAEKDDFNQNKSESELLDDLDEWIKEEPFPDWFEEKIDIPLLGIPSANQDIRTYQPVRDDVDTLKLLNTDVKQQQQQQQQQLQIQPQTSSEYIVPSDTQSLLQEFETVFGEVENNYALTPPQSPEQHNVPDVAPFTNYQFGEYPQGLGKNQFIITNLQQMIPLQVQVVSPNPVKFVTVSPSLPTSGLSSPALSSPGLPSPILSSPGLPSPILSSPGLPSPILSSPGLPSPILSSPALPSPVLSSPGLPSAGLPSPVYEEKEQYIPNLEQIVPSPAPDLIEELAAVDELIRTRVEDLETSSPVPSEEPSTWANEKYTALPSPEDDVPMTVEITPPSPSTTSNSSFESYEELGDDPEWVPNHAALPVCHKVTSGRKRSKPYSRIGTEEKRLRKKEQNKNAATRYRQKKKAEVEEILGEEKDLADRNEELQAKVSDITREIKYLKGLMRDVFKAKGMIK